jgi:hypothetical protein
MRWRAGVLLAASLIPLGAEPAGADPQVNGGMTIGGGVGDMRATPYGAFHLGLRGDVLFFRERNADMALGPYAELGTVAFSSFETGGGLSWLVPASTTLPFVLSAGGYARHTGPLSWEPGLATSLFFGSRSYNFHSAYALMLGGFLQMRYGLGDGRQADLILGLHVDLALLAWPWVYAYQSITR